MENAGRKARFEEDQSSARNPARRKPSSPRVHPVPGRVGFVGARAEPAGLVGDRSCTQWGRSRAINSIVPGVGRPKEGASGQAPGRPPRNPSFMFEHMVRVHHIEHRILERDGGRAPSPRRDLSGRYSERPSRVAPVHPSGTPQITDREGPDLGDLRGPAPKFSAR